jgi:hypothetical protein
VTSHLELVALPLGRASRYSSSPETREQEEAEPDADFPPNWPIHPFRALEPSVAVTQIPPDQSRDEKEQGCGRSTEDSLVDVARARQPRGVQPGAEEHNGHHQGDQGDELEVDAWTIESGRAACLSTSSNGVALAISAGRPRDSSAAQPQTLRSHTPTSRKRCSA